LYPPECRGVKYTTHPAGLKAFGKRMRELREARNLSQEALAWKADSELSQISRMERGIVNAGLSQIFKIAEALEVHPKELFDFEMPPNE
jgi:transcriptional regulator with XRE-family HTH domain